MYTHDSLLQPRVVASFNLVDQVLVPRPWPVVSPRFVPSVNRVLITGTLS